MTTFYLDLDRTLFRTERARELFDAIEQLYPANMAIKGGYANRGAYYVYARKESNDPTYYHDIVRQLQDAGLDPKEVFAGLQGVVGDGRFEYDGAAELVHTLQARGRVVVLTYGEDDYQRNKARLCPSLADIEVITLIGSKVEYLNEHAAIGNWIIDDKPMTKLKPGIRAVLVDHGGDTPSAAHSLLEVLAIIRES